VGGFERGLVQRLGMQGRGDGRVGRVPRDCFAASGIDSKPNDVVPLAFWLGWSWAKRREQERQRYDW